jgi:polyisoprenoid-binding protein YceI
MADPAYARKALAADMLDAARFPTMSYDGACAGNTVGGALTLHGVTRPLTLALTRDGSEVAGVGRLLRHEYGIDGMPHLLGQTIKIRFLTNPNLPTAHQR